MCLCTIPATIGEPTITGKRTAATGGLTAIGEPTAVGEPTITDKSTAATGGLAAIGEPTAVGDRLLPVSRLQLPED